jgi:hypothetical protein
MINIEFNKIFYFFKIFEIYELTKKKQEFKSTN